MKIKNSFNMLKILCNHYVIVYRHIFFTYMYTYNSKHFEVSYMCNDKLLSMDIQYLKRFSKSYWLILLNQMWYLPIFYPHPEILSSVLFSTVWGTGNSRPVPFPENIEGKSGVRFHVNLCSKAFKNSNVEIDNI